MGDSTSNLIDGKEGNDLLLDSGGNDTLIGGEGRGFLGGGVGAHLMRSGNQAFDFIGTSQFSGNAGELRHFTWGGNNFNIIETDNNGEGRADMQIFVNLTSTMSASDYIL